MAHDVYDSVGQVQKGEIPNVLVSHLQIPIKEGIAQATNKKRLNDLLIPGKSPIVDDNATPMDQASARLAHAGKGLIAPWNAGEPLATGTKSIPEFLANQVNIYTPHLKGFQGAPSGNLDWMGYNTSNEKPSTGMDIIHAQDQVRAMLGNQGMADWQKVKDLRQQGFTDSSSDAYGLANAMIVKNPKLYDAYAITAQAAAKAKGMQVDPQYDPKNKDVALRYLAYQGWTTAQQAAYSSKNTDIVQLQREINTYKSSKDYADNRNEIATAMGEPAPKPFVPNPIYANQPGKNIPIFDNKQLATKQVYDAMPTGAFNSQEYVNKEIYLANHPEAQLVTIAEIPYWQAILQNKWDNRPQGQDVSSFIAANTKADGSLPNIKGVDQNGKIIPNYNQLDSPKIKLWMAHPEQGALLNIYYAGLGSKNYPIANAAMASLQSMGFDYAKYKADNKQFSIDNPYSADLGTGDTTGLGIDFGTGASGGSGGGGGYSSSGNGATTGMWNAVNDTSNIRVRTKLQDNTAASNAIFKASPGIDWNKELIALKKATPKMTDFKFTDGGKISIKNRRPSSDVTLKNSLGRII
jgi:hypothetical protein